MAVILRIEHSIRDYGTWKKAFDADPAGRKRHGALGYTVCRPVDDSAAIAVDIEFDSIEKAQGFAGAMAAVWKSNAAAPALVGAPRARLLEIVATDSEAS